MTSVDCNNTTDSGTEAQRSLKHVVGIQCNCFCDSYSLCWTNMSTSDLNGQFSYQREQEKTKILSCGSDVLLGVAQVMH